MFNSGKSEIHLCAQMQIHILKRTIFLEPEKNHVMAGGNYKKKIMPKMPKFPKTILY